MSAPAPASTSTRRISSVAYADELIASELKIASAFFFESRSEISSWIESGRPKRTPRARANRRPAGVRGTDADSLATSVPSGVYRKYAACGRSMRTRRSPSLRPLSGPDGPWVTGGRRRGRASAEDRTRARRKLGPADSRWPVAGLWRSAAAAEQPGLEGRQLRLEPEQEDRADHEAERAGDHTDHDVQPLPYPAGNEPRRRDQDDDGVRDQQPDDERDHHG